MGVVRPKKKLGQHFLADENIARKIAGSLLDTDSPILEIGPGMGMLTRFLLERFPSQVWVSEIDSESVNYLREHFPQLEGHIIEGDVLALDLRGLFSHEIAWIGNLPYNISSPIFFRLLENHEQVPQMIAMVQKEVAERIAAPHGSKTYGILSVLLQAYYEVEYLFTVSEKVFVPPPKVKSAVIKLVRKPNPPPISFRILKSLVKTAFNQRRKMLRNALSSYPGLLKTFPAIVQKRAEQLSVEEYLELALFTEKSGLPGNPA